MLNTCTPGDDSYATFLAWTVLTLFMVETVLELQVLSCLRLTTIFSFGGTLAPNSGDQSQFLNYGHVAWISLQFWTRVMLWLAFAFMLGLTLNIYSRSPILNFSIV